MSATNTPIPTTSTTPGRETWTLPEQALVPAAGLRRTDTPPRATRTRTRRVLLPIAGPPDPSAIDTAIRFARAEKAILVAAYLLVVPLRYGDEDAPPPGAAALAMPLLEAVQRAAARAGIPVDTRIARGRALVDALRRLFHSQPYDHIVASAPADGQPGFTENDLVWLLRHAPAQTLVLKAAA